MYIGIQCDKRSFTDSWYTLLLVQQCDIYLIMCVIFGTCTIFGDTCTTMRVIFGTRTTI